jgi:uncharacterized protein
MPTLSWECDVKAPIDEVFAWHARPGAFNRLSPPWRSIEIKKYTKPGEAENRIVLRLPIVGPLGLLWELEHDSFNPPHRFSDRQVRGPFKSWRHVHAFSSIDSNTTRLTDSVSYTLPLATDLSRPFAKRELDRLFAFRHAVLQSDTMLHGRFLDSPRKTVLIAGSSGFIGSALVDFLQTAGHQIRRLVRRTPNGPDEFHWNPSTGEIDRNAFEGVDAVINFAGANIAESRWSPAVKERIVSSRIKSATLLADTIASMKSPPEVAIMASATGYYGDTSGKLADENTPYGGGFLASTGKQWEEASSAISTTSCRLVNLRIGTVLGAKGGALKKMLPAFKMGLGGTLGGGSQRMSWIALQDLLGVIEYLIYTQSIAGAVNAVSPVTCTNTVFTKTLAQTIKRPALFRVPALILRTALGEMANELLLQDNAVTPSRLLQAGYVFSCRELEDALRFELGLLVR